jgi:hypothetical protein
MVETQDGDLLGRQTMRNTHRIVARVSRRPLAGAPSGRPPPAATRERFPSNHKALRPRTPPPP